jgi:hypothetical protein
MTCVSALTVDPADRVAAVVAVDPASLLDDALANAINRRWHPMTTT